MTETETLRLRHVADMQRRAPALVARLDWPAERLARHRTSELRRLLRVATERSPWHRRRLAGIDVDRIDEAGLPELPVMTKDDLMEHFDEIVTDDRLTLDGVENHLDLLTGDGYLFDSYHAIASGGSSGRRGVFVYDWESWATCYIGMMRHELRAAVGQRPAGDPVTMALVAAGRPTHGSSALFRSFSSAALALHRFPIGAPFDETVDALNRLQPTVFSGYPSGLFALAHAAQRGDLRISPERVVSYSEPLLPEIRSCLEDTFGVPVVNWWCASESPPLAMGCGHGPWTHLCDDLVIVEPVDTADQAVPAGEPSAKVFLTNLYNHALPLIRYELTDQVTLLDERCPCGSEHRLVGDVEGRLDDAFYFAGVTVHPHLFRSPLGRHRHVLEYQVRQTSSGAHILVRRDGPVDLDGLQAEIEIGLSRFIVQPQVSVVAVEAIGRQDTGKLKRFVPLAASGAALSVRGEPCSS